MHGCGYFPCWAVGSSLGGRRCIKISSKIGLSFVSDLRRQGYATLDLCEAAASGSNGVVPVGLTIGRGQEIGCARNREWRSCEEGLLYKMRTERVLGLISRESLAQRLAHWFAGLGAEDGFDGDYPTG